MNITAQKILKIFHLTFAGISLGGLTATLVLILLKLADAELTFSNSIDYAIYILNNQVILYSVYGSILTTLIFGLYTNWGLVKYYWIIIKWILIVLLAVLFMWFFIPNINGLTSLSDSGLHVAKATSEYSSYLLNAFKYNVFIIVIYILLFFVSTLKPFGKRKKDLFANRTRVRLIVIIILIVAVAFNIMGTVSLNKLRNMPIKNTELSAISDDVYTATFNEGGGPYTAKVTVSNNRIVDIELKSERNSKYVHFALPIALRIKDKQNADVDAITGATTTSKCFMKAVELALESASVKIEH